MRSSWSCPTWPTYQSAVSLTKLVVIAGSIIQANTSSRTWQSHFGMQWALMMVHKRLCDGDKVCEFNQELETDYQSYGSSVASVAVFKVRALNVSVM